MKKEKGVTLISLIIYVIMLTFAIAGISAITSSFYSNVNELDGDAKGAVAFSKINMYLLKDLKSEDVELESGGNNRITLRVNGKTINYRIQGRFTL